MEEKQKPLTQLYKEKLKITYPGSVTLYAMSDTFHIEGRLFLNFPFNTVYGYAVFPTKELYDLDWYKEEIELPKFRTIFAFKSMFSEN